MISFTLLFFCFSFHVLLMCLLSKVSFASNPASILKSPKSQNATVLKSTANMICEAEADQLMYVIDNQNGDYKTTQDNGFIQSSPKEIDQGRLRRELKILITKEMAGRVFEIFCRGYNYANSTPIDSDIALFTVAGLLREPESFEYMIVDNLYLLVSWTPPPTLENTDILGYNVTVNNETYDFSYITQTLINYSDFSACDNLDITISGYNGVDGEIAELATQYVPSSVTGKNRSITVEYKLELIRGTGEVAIVFVITVSRFCEIEKPSSVFATIISTENIIHDHKEFPLVSNELSEGVLSSNDSILLNNSQKYHIVVEFWSNVDYFRENKTIHICFSCDTKISPSITMQTLVPSASMDVKIYNNGTLPMAPNKFVLSIFLILALFLFFIN